jgi:hypothetical protein
MSDVVKDSSGQAVLKSGSGKLFLADPKEAQRLIGQGEYSAATSEEIQAHNANETSSVAGAAARGAVVGTVGGALAAPKLATALGAAALGTADPLAEISGRKFYEDMAAAARHFGGGGLGEEDEARAAARTQLESDAAAHPYAAGAGELAGNIAGAGVGGLGALGRGAGSLLARGAGALGAGARLAPAIGGVGAGVLEGGAFGADAASESAWVKNAPVTAQQSLAAIGLGALFGGGISLAATGAAKLPAVAKLLRRGEAVEGLEGSAAVEASEAGEQGALMAAPERKGPAALEDVPEGMMEKGRAWVNDLGDEAAVDALSRGNKPALKRLGAGEAPSLAKKRETGALLHEMGILAPGRSEGDMWAAAQSQTQKQGSRMGAVMDQLDKEAGYADATKLVDRLEVAAQDAETVGKFANKPEGKQAADFIRERIQDLREKSANGIVTHQDIHNERMYWDTIGYERTSAGHLRDTARDVRAIISDELKAEIQKASPDLRAEWDMANSRYGAAKWATDTLAERVSVRSGANRLLSPSDYGTAAVTLLSGHPVAAIAAGLGNKILRERGYSTFAAVAKRLAGEAVDVGAAPAVATPTARRLSALVAHSTERVESGIGQFLGSASRGATGRTARAASSLVGRMMSSDPVDARAAYADHVREVQTVASSPDVALSRMQGITGNTLPLYAPGVHAEMIATAQRAANYLSSKAPAPAQDPNSITPQVKSAPPVSIADTRTYAARVEGVENPLSLLDDLNSTKGPRAEKVEAVREVHPELYEQMRQSVFTHLAERTTPVPYRQRVTLDITLNAGGTLAPSLNPKNLAVMQMAGKSLAAQVGKAPRGPSPKVSGMLSTRSQQISGGPR